MLQQGTDEWRQARCGSIGASDAPSVVRRTKTGYSADRESLMAVKVLERITNKPIDIYKTPAMIQGTEREPDARLLYQMVKGVEVEEVGLITHPRINGTHASPDGFVLVPGGTAIAGLIEIKCPQPAKHLDTLISEQISNDHIVQMQWQMACTVHAWCDFVSFNPDFPPHMQMWIKRVHRDSARIAELEGEITQFIRELEAKVDKLTRRYEMAA
jgi:putative phage-type endonuclease